VDLAARFEPAVAAQEVAPRDRDALARQRALEHDARAREQACARRARRARRRSDPERGVDASAPGTRSSGPTRPAAGDPSDARSLRANSARNPANESQAASPRPASSASASSSRAGRSDAAEASSSGNDATACREHVEHGQRIAVQWRTSPGSHSAFHVSRSARGRSASGIERAAQSPEPHVRPQAHLAANASSSSHCAGSLHAQRQDVPLPRVGRRLESGQLLHDREHAARAFELRVLRRVLPRGRKRRNSAADTGWISERSRSSV
jgi:hypothetical protein